MLPIFLRMRIRNKSGKRVTLFIPIILLWILLFALMLILFPLVLLAALLTWGSGQGKILLRSYPMIFALLCNLGGLYIQVEKPNEELLFYFK